jgi:hypothetical protein
MAINPNQKGDEMRTRGTFADIYQAAKELYNDTTHSPINPVVRLEGSTWMLESSLEPTDGSFECSLDAFHGWFSESYRDAEFVPSEAHEAMLLQMEE